MNRSTSTPYLPRYQSPSPARSPHLEARRYASLRSISHPSQRIYYIDSSPVRVINSYHVHHSPSPHRTYKVHLSSSKINHYLTRTTRSQSAYDINSSHVYTSQEDISYKPLQEAANRRAESCEDIYHKASFFPDITPSESGVSFGESEEGSAFGGEDDNASQHSFDSSGALYEVTMDTELDKGDSDNFSGPDCTGDRVLSTLHENYLDENIRRRKLQQSLSHREQQSSDASFANLLPLEARNRQSVTRLSWDSDKLPTEALRVIIPDSESSAKIGSDSHKAGHARAVSSTPLAHSTPHVSPVGPEDLKLHATASWNADDPFGEVRGYKESTTYATAEAMFEPGRETKLSFKLEDSSCASSCSEDNYSDVSNITISSQGSRKTKLVKKHSDKPASAKRNILSYLSNLPCTSQAENAPSGNSVDIYHQHVLGTSGNLSSEDSGCFTSTQNKADVVKDRETAMKSVKYGEAISKDEPNWWTAFNWNTDEEQQAKIDSDVRDNRDKLSSFQRDVRIHKPLTASIPLISAGKHGQEKLRRLSQTPQSPSKSPIQSLGETVQTWDSLVNESNRAEDTNRVNIDDQQIPQGPQICELTHRDYVESQQCNVEEDGERANVPTGCEQSMRPVVASENTLDGLSVWVSPLDDLETSHGELSCELSVPRESGQMCPEREELVMNALLQDGHSEMARVEGVQSGGSDDMDNMKYKHDSLPSHGFDLACESEQIINSYSAETISDERSRPVDTLFASGVSLQKAESLTPEGVHLGKCENVAESVINEQSTDTQLAELAFSDELDSVKGGLLETREATDSFGLPVLVSQVLELSIPDGTSCVASKSVYLDSDTRASEKNFVSEQKLTESDALVTDLDDDTCVHVDKNRVHENLMKATNSEVEQEQFRVGLCSENTFFSDEMDSVLDRKNFYTVSIDYLSSFNCAAVIDSEAGRIVLKEAEQQEHALSSSVENTSTVDSGVTAENTDMESVLEPGTRGNRSLSGYRETPQMVARVTETAEDSSAESTDIPPHRDSWVSHDSTSSLLSLSDLNDGSQKTDTAFSELSQNGKQDVVDQQITRKSGVNKRQANNSDYTSHSSRQQETEGTSICTDIPRPVDESINRQGSVAPRGDQGFNKEEHFRTEKTARFVDRGEFIHTARPRETLMFAAEVSSRRVDDIHCASIPENVTNDQTVHRPSLDLSCGDDCSRVGIVFNKSGSNTNEDYTPATTDELCSDAGKEDTVTVVASTETSYLDVHLNTTNRLPVYSLTITLSEPAAGQGIRGRLNSVTSSDQYLASPKATARLTDQTATLASHSPKAEGDSTDVTIASTDQVFPFKATKVCVTTYAGELLAPDDQTTCDQECTGDMPRSDHLDNLQAQLSLISNDFHSERLNASKNADQYQDRAEATSVIDTANFARFSNTSCGNVQVNNLQEHFSTSERSFVATGELLNNHVKSDAGEVCNASSLEGRECYDNDYDYVTSDSSKGAKLFPRPQQQPHLVKPGQFKASSLWTLQEEAENAMSPMSSPKLPRVSLASHEGNCNYQLVEPAPTLHATLVKDKPVNVIEMKSRECNPDLVYVNRAVEAEPTDHDDSDVGYSSMSIIDSDSKGSINFGRENSLLNETKLDPVINDRDIDCQDALKIQDIDYVNIFPGSQEFDDVFTIDSVNRSHPSALSTDDKQSKNRIQSEHESESHTTNCRSNRELSVSSPESAVDHLSPLDRLCASLEQFTEPSNDGWRLILLAENATATSDSTEIDMSIGGSAHTDHNSDDEDDDTVSDASWKHNLGLDTSRASLASADGSEASIYTSTGRAETKKTSSFDYDFPSFSTETGRSSDPKRIAIERREDQVREEKIKQFENLLDEFSRSILPHAVISEFIFLREKRTDRSGSSSTSSTEDLYKSFTNEDSEKKQNHVCIVVEDENMNTFRFKRYLKKSHTKRKKGKKVLRFLSKLGCVSETLGLSASTPSLRVKQSDEDVQVFSTDSLASSKHATSNPILCSSTSFRHHDILNNSPLRYTDDYNNTPFSSNRSLDSIRSKADSAYSSISESVAGSMSSPAFHRGHSTSFRIPPASSGSVSSVFCSGSVSGEWTAPDSVFSTSADNSMQTSDSFGKYDFGYHSIDSPADGKGDIMSALSDVFDQLNVCEGEIDSALLNRVRHGHVKAEIGKQ